MNIESGVVHNLLIGIGMVASTITFFVVRLSRQIDRLKEGAAAAERDMAKMPNEQHILRLHERIDEILGTLRETNMMLGDISGQVKRIDSSGCLAKGAKCS